MNIEIMRELIASLNNRLDSDKNILMILESLCEDVYILSLQIAKDNVDNTYCKEKCVREKH